MELRALLSMRRLALVVVALSGLAACASILGVESIHVEAEDAGSTPPPPPADAMPEADAPFDAGTEAGDCPGSGGPSMVRVGEGDASFCIDGTEVTFGQYAAFMATSPSTAGQPQECGWNTTFSAVASGPADHPATGVDWCDARAFCAWAGKRLCGRFAPVGPLDPADLASPLVSTLLASCTALGTRDGTYATLYDAGACNVGLADGGPEAVGSRPTCEAVPGVRDLIGNVWEWVDSCKAQDGGPVLDGGDHTVDSCFFVGGAWGSDPTNPCRIVSGSGRTFAAIDVGFRCCAP